jgi:hypothetical protein
LQADDCGENAVMKQDEAKEAILKEWPSWAAENNVTKAKG